MVLIQGKGISAGIAMGSLYFYRRTPIIVSATQVAEIETERQRIATAQDKCVRQLSALADKAWKEVGEDFATLFETHAMFVRDEDFVGCIISALYEQHCTAEQAVEIAGEQFTAMLMAMDNAYMQARAIDIEDVTRRILSNLTGVTDDSINSDKPTILAAVDLTPSEILQMDKSKILGFITQGGSGNSHTAILARTMGIPAICGLGDALRLEMSGRTTYIDGETGTVVIEPDVITLTAFQAKLEKQQEMKHFMETMKGQEDVTLDGRKIRVCCNINNPDDVYAVLSNDGQGIGLFRSEFLYLASNDYPTEDEQFEAYREVAVAMGGKRVVIRTLDIGTDKQAGYINLQNAENPALGIRGIRICLSRPEVFRTQLRAIYRASVYGKVAIMFPMITSVWEVRECKRICQKVMAELDAEDVPYRQDIEIGIMIETPASVFIAEELAKEVDFFSVGTNDLIQYILACDRQANNLSKFFDPHHPAILRALKITVDAAHKAGIWIGICGELGADLPLLKTFLAMGIDELSVSPSSVLPLRAEIRKSTVETCTIEDLEC